MRRGSVRRGWWLAVALVAVHSISPAGVPARASAGEARSPVDCPPLPGGSDSFPSTAKIVIDNEGFGEPFVVRLSSAGQPDAVLQRAPQVGDSIDVELIDLELAGFHPRVGAIHVRQSPTLPSVGQIRNVVLDGSCELAGGETFVELFVEVELPDLLQTWVHQDPIRVEAPLGGLPPQDVPYEVLRVNPIVMRDKITSAERGLLYYALHHADPPFPAPGSDCSDALLTADLRLFGPGSTANLIGFGPMTVLRGATVAGGTCHFGGNPCETDDDCAGLDTCARDRLETEIFALDVAGFDPLLGGWAMATRPEAGTSDCCVTHPGLGCSDPACEELVCGLDSYCCTVAWDSLCAGLAASEPICTANCLDPDAAPSEGTVQSVEPDRTYPAISRYDLYIRIDSNSQGSLRNEASIPVQSAAPVTQHPPDPNTDHLYGGSPVPMLDETGTPAGEISNVVLTSQVPEDCFPPPPAGEECFDAALRLELALPPCPPEMLSLDGLWRLLRDDPREPTGLGQEVIDRVIAGAWVTGTGACTGPVAVRVSSALASFGPVSSLAPEEFYPAESFFDVHIAIGTGAGVLAADSLPLAAAVNTLPLAQGEVHVGPDSPIDLRNGGGTKVGEILGVTHEILDVIQCPADSASSIRFTGPAPDAFTVAIPGGGGGVEYDVVRGDLGSLVAGGGGFSSAACLVSDVGPEIIDSDVPTAGNGFYYVARDGFRAFDGSWNGAGPAQQGNRDAKLPSCP